MWGGVGGPIDPLGGASDCAESGWSSSSARGESAQLRCNQSPCSRVGARGAMCRLLRISTPRGLIGINYILILYHRFTRFAKFHLDFIRNYEPQGVPRSL